MIRKVSERRGMTFDDAPLDQQGNIGAGVMSREMTYNYPQSGGSVGDMPTYTQMVEDWVGRTTDAAPETDFLITDSGGQRTTKITRPDGAQLRQIADLGSGLLIEDGLYSGEVALSRSKAFWEIGAYNSPRPTRTESYDERGRMTATEYSYDPAEGSRYNSVTDARAFGYSEELLRRTHTQYLNDGNYNGSLQNSGTLWWKQGGGLSGGPNWRGQHLFNLVSATEVYAGDDVTRLSRTEYQYDNRGLTDNPGMAQYNSWYNPHTPPRQDCNYEPDMEDPDCINPTCYGTYPPCDGYCPQIYVCHDVQQYDPFTLYRGNVTQIKRYADAISLDQGTAVVETRTYDVAGNVRVQSTSCCEETSLTYTTATQYAWPVLQTSGSPTIGSPPDTSKQNTSSASYDYWTGLVETSKDANDRESRTIYDFNTQRPVYEYSPTGGYQYHIYNDMDLWVVDMVYELGRGGADFASRSEKYLDGLGRVIKEVAYGRDYVTWDAVETKFDKLGRVSQQTRPYRIGAETPQWSRVTYDLLDRPEKTIAPDDGFVTRSYNQADPPGSSGQPGPTVKVADPWGRERWARSDALGRMVEVAEPDPNGNGTLSSGAMFTTYNYDDLDRLVEVNQGAQTRSFRYDSLGRMTHQKLAERDATLNDGGDWIGVGQWSDVFTYDNRSNLTRHVDARGVKTSFKYEAGGVEDPLNRLLEVEYDKSGSPSPLINNIPVAPKVSYAYMTTTPGDKRRVRNVFVDQGMGNETMSYDSEGRLSRVVQTFTGRESYPIVTDYIWDSLDRLKENTYPMQYGAGEIRKKVEPAYDIASRMDSVKFGGATYASNPVYNAASQTTSLNVGGQIAESYNYDPKTGLMTSQQVNRGADVLVDLKYNYTLNNDANNSGAKTGQLTGITDLKNQARNRAYEYDKLGRLGKVKGGVNAFTNPTWNQTYSYDRYGNRGLVQHSELAMAPVSPGSQSRSDLIGKIGQGAGGAANRIFSADDPFAALGVNEGNGSSNAGFSESDNTGTPVRGGPRVHAEENSNAPSANVVGRELLAKRSAGAQPAAPQKEYGYGSGLSRSPVAAQGTSVVSVSPSAYQTPDGYDDSVYSPSNTGHLSTSASTSVYGYGSSTQSQSCRWFAFNPVSGQITRITLKFNWRTGGSVSTNVPSSDNASASASFQIRYYNGSQWNYAVTKGDSLSTSSFGGETRYFGDSGSFSVDLPANTPINQIMVYDQLYANASTGGTEGYANASAYVEATISNISLEVEIVNDAAFVSQSVPATMTAGEAYPVTVTMLNQGTTTWTPGQAYRLGSQNPHDNTTWAIGRVNLLPGDSVIPGATTTFSFVVTAPSSPGSYNFQWRMVQELVEWFGAMTPNIAVQVVPPDTTPPVISNVAAVGINLYSATINWDTNETSDSQVEYGTTAAYGQPMPLNPLPVTAHSQGISGLTPGTVYHYRVWSKDANGNLAASGDNTFTTAPLVIYNVAAGDITASCVTITWTTNVPTNSQVEYGTTTAYGQFWPETTPDLQLVTAHSQIILNRLTAGTAYHYRVRSRDASDNLVVSGDYTFTTGPLMVSYLTAGNITTSRATITWNTNENADSQLEYGTTTAYGHWTTLDPVRKTAHTQVLNNLTPGTVYYYRTRSTDAAGNIAFCGGSSFTTAQSVPIDGLANLSYNPANNRINTPGFEYDPHGNQTRAVINASGTQQQYRFDCANRLVEVLDGSGNVLATHAYGAGNQRLMSVEGGVTKYFAWAGGQIIAEYEASGANALIWKTSYIYLGGRLLATTSGAGGTDTRFHHPDRLGTRLVTNASDGAVVSEQLSMPFGTMLPITSVYGGENSYQNPTLSNPSKKRFTLRP